MNSWDFSVDENWVCNRQITWFAGKRPPLFPACLKYEPVPLKSCWKFIVCLWHVFSDMICVNTCVIARVVVCILSIAALTVFCYTFWLHAMLGHDLTTANRHDHAWTETWAQKSVRCASCYPSCDHLTHADRALWGANSAGWKVREKLFNLLCPTGCGYHDHLEKGGVVGPNMGM